MTEKVYSIIRQDPDPSALVKPYVEALRVESHGSILFGYAYHPAIYDQASKGPAVLMLHGHPGGDKNMDLADYVLGHFSKAERESIDDAIVQTIDAINTILDGDIDAAMNQHNKKAK